MPSSKLSFENLCQKHESWIIEYKPLSHSQSLYVIWFTHPDEDDKFLVHNNGEIISMSNPNLLINVVIKNQIEIPYFHLIESWIVKCMSLSLYSQLVMQPSKLISNLNESTISPELCSNYVNLINAIVDYGHQMNNDLLEKSNKPIIKDFWNYCYDEHFWSNTTSFQEKNNVINSIDFKSLKSAVSDLVISFEQHIKIHFE